MEGYSYFLWVHIFSGFTALISGLVTMATKKGSAKHIFIGRIYFYSMLVVFLTTVAMFAFKPQKLLFLFLIGIFSFYNSLSGVRLLYYKKSELPSRKADWVIASFVFCTGLTMVVLGCYKLLNSNTGPAILYLVFGTLCSIMASTDLSFLVQNGWQLYSDLYCLCCCKQFFLASSCCVDRTWYYR